MDVAETNEVGLGDGGDCEDKTVERSLLIPKNLDGTTDYLIFDTRLAFT